MAIVVSLYVFFQIKYHFFTLDHISWINTFDGDLSYLTDRLLLNAHFPDYVQISSTDVDYGSELFFFIPLLKLINLVFGLNPLHSYYVITGMHLISGITAIFLLSSFFQDHYLEKSLWFIVVFMSPLFGFHLSYAKPDANVVMLLIALSLYFCSKTKISFKFAVAAIFFAASGFAIKWWGLFCLIPIFVALLKEEKDSSLYVKFARIGLWVSTLLMLAASHFIVNEILQVLTKNNIHNLLTRSSPILLKFFFFTCAFIVFIGSYWLLKVLNKKTKKLFRVMKIILFQAIIFTTSYLLIAMPFIASGFYLKSVFSFSVGVFKANEIGHETRRSIWENALFWFSEFKDYHYLSPLLAFVFILLFAFCFKKKKQFNASFPVSITATAYFLAGFTFFIVFLLNRNNRAMIAMLYPFYLMVFFYFFIFFKNSFTKIIAITAIALVQIIYQSNGKQGNLLTIYSERDQLRNKVIESNLWLEKNFSHIKNFYMCDYAFPQTVFTPFKFNYNWRYHCNTNLESDLINQQSSDAWIIASETIESITANHPELLSKKKLTLYSQLFVNERMNYTIIENLHAAQSAGD
jgi:hypothetical protein